MSVYGQYVLEFSISDSLKTLKDKLIKAINNLLDKAQAMVNKHVKNSTIKKILDTIIRKLKSLLNRTKKVNDMNEANDISEEVNKIKEEIENTNNLIQVHVNLANKILDGKISRKDVEEYIKAIENKYGEGSFDSYQVKKKPISEWNKKYLDNLEIQLASGACSKEFYLHMADVADYVYGKTGSTEYKSNFKPKQKYEAIEKGIKNKDIPSLRESLASICYTCRDLSNGDLFENIKYVESHGIKIKDDKLIGKTISSQKSEFTDDDFSRAVFELKRNFCDERIQDVKNIGEKLYR